MTLDTPHTRLADDPAMPRQGDVLDGRYHIEDVLGEGGFAAVFRATDAKTGKAFAIKVLDPMMSRREEFRRRFFLEIANSSKLNHVNTIHISDQGETDSGCLYLVMELLEGKSLDDLLHERGPMPSRLVHSVAVQTLRSLREAHALNLLHRDIKPANIFIVENATDEEDVFVKVVDFGIAKSMDSANDAALTSTGQVMCSPHYVAPERVVDHETYPASDLYSLGISMIEMLEGKPPYDGDNTIQLVMMHAQMDNEVPLGDATLASPLVDIIRRATHKDHTQRFQSADEMLQALRALKNAPANTATPSPLADLQAEVDALPTPPEWRQGGYWSIGIPVLILILVLMVGAFFWKLLRSPEDTAEEQAITTTHDAPNNADDTTAEDNPDDDHAALEGVAPTTTHTLQSDPQGAQVFFNDKAQGRTPLTFEDDTLPQMPFTLRLTLPDAREHVETIRELSDLENTVFAISNATDAAPENTASQTPKRTTRSNDSSTGKDDSSASSSTSKDDDAAPVEDPEEAPSSEAAPPQDSPSAKPSAPEQPRTPPASESKPSQDKPNAAEEALERIRSGGGGGSYTGSGSKGGYH